MAALLAILYKLIYFVVAITLLVLIHEGGHFLVAKAVGMKVNEFAIGMGPKLWSRQKGETLYSLRAIPIGGFIKPEGEDEESAHPRAFGNKPLWARAAVVAAGPIFNFILAYLIVIVLFTFTGVDFIRVNSVLENQINTDTQLMQGDLVTKVNNKNVYITEELTDIIKKSNARNIEMKVLRNNSEKTIIVPTVKSQITNENVLKVHTVVVGNVTEGMPASSKGILVGDLISKVNGKEIYSFEELIKEVDNSKGNSIRLNLIRGSNELTVDIAPVFSDKHGRYLIGINPNPTFDSQQVVMPYTQNFKNSINYSTSLTKQVVYGVKRLFTGKMTRDEMAGPVRIYAITGAVAMQGLRAYIHFLALLSLSLGLFNIFPIPALDGGRLLFMGIEGLRGKAVDQKKEATVHLVGFALLLGLMVFITFNDIKLLLGM